MTNLRAEILNPNSRNSKKNVTNFELVLDVLYLYVLVLDVQYDNHSSRLKVNIPLNEHGKSSL